MKKAQDDSVGLQKALRRPVMKISERERRLGQIRISGILTEVGF
jgi:hypothetical protein